VSHHSLRLRAVAFLETGERIGLAYLSLNGTSDVGWVNDVLRNRRSCCSWCSPCSIGTNSFHHFQRPRSQYCLGRPASRRWRYAAGSGVPSISLKISAASRSSTL
jgi:hypothetical protein